MRDEQAQVGVEVKRWKVEKFDGDKLPGDGKQPVEIIVGGDDIPTRALTPNDPDFALHVTKETP